MRKIKFLCSIILSIKKNMKMRKKKIFYCIFILLIFILFTICKRTNILEKFNNKYKVIKDLSNLNQNLLVELEGGLCNKLRTLNGFGYLAKLKNVKLFAIWEYSPECPTNFDDLFYNISNIIILKNKNNIPNNVVNIGKCSNYVRRQWNIKDNNHKKFYKNFKLKENVITEINNFLGKNDLNNTLGLHIRRTDHIIYLKNSNNMHLYRDDTFYINEINKFMKNNKNGKIFLATDNKKTQDFFINNFNNIIYLKKIEKNNKLRTTYVKDALIDIIILSKCKKFVGSLKSSFTTTANIFRKNKIF